MALNFKFVDGMTYEYLSVLETEEFWNGSNRRTLSFEMDRAAANIEILDSLCTEENCATLELINTESGVTNIYDGYVLKLKVGVEPVCIQAETPDTPAVYEDRIMLKLGRRTYIEEQLHKLEV